MQNYFELAGGEASAQATRKNTQRSRLRRMWIAENVLDEQGKTKLFMGQIRDRVAKEFGDKVSTGQIGFDIHLLRYGRAAVLGEALPPKRPSFIAPGQWAALQRTLAQKTGGQPPAPSSPVVGSIGRTKKTSPAAAMPPKPDPLTMLLGVADAFKSFGTVLEDIVRELRETVPTNGNGHGNGQSHTPTTAPVRVLPVEPFPKPIPSESQKEELIKSWPTHTKAGWRLSYAPHFVKQILNLDANGQKLCARTLERFAINPSDPTLRRKKITAMGLAKRYHQNECALHYIRATVSYRLFVNVNDKRRGYIFEDWLKRGEIPGFSEA